MKIEIAAPAPYELMQVTSVLRSMGGAYGQQLADLLEQAANAPPPPPEEPPPEEPPP